MFQVKSASAFLESGRQEGCGVARRSAKSEDGKQFQYTTLKLRLDPSPEQAELFEKTFGCCRYIWNQMLADQQRFYNETGAHFIPTPAKYKNDAPFLREVDNQTLIQEHNKLTQAFRVFFKNPETFGHPNFKRKKEDRDSFTACNHFFESGPTIYTTRDGIRMTKAGIVRAKFHRRPQAWWKLKRVTVDKTRTGKYFCSILYECPVREPERVLPTEETTVGLKYSLPHFYVTDGGELADPPHWLKESREKLAGIQQRLSRMQPGSKNYRETTQTYRLLHEHIANQRRDFIHKESRRIANAWNAVCVREDDLTELTREMPQGNFVDSGFGMFRICLRYKLERQGKALIAVDRYFPSTRTCSACGFVGDAVSYKQRSWRCSACGAVHSREVNAAKNIKTQGLAQYLGTQAKGQST